MTVDPNYADLVFGCDRGLVIPQEGQLLTHVGSV